MKNSDYWAQRFRLLNDALQDKSYSYTKNLEKQYNSAIADIDKQMRAWYQRFAKNNAISYADAQKLLTSGQLKEFKWTVEEYIKKAKESAINGAWVKELENASARVHISRLEALKLQLRHQAEMLTGGRANLTHDAAQQAYINGYYHTTYEVQRGLGYGWSMQALNTGALEKVLSRPWTVDDRTFTARCWTDKNKLVQTVNNELTKMLATGAPPDKAIEAIVKQFGVSRANAGRLIMTESAHFAVLAQHDSFKDLDVEQYKIVETFDKNTCALCGDMDGKHFPMSEFAAGANAPPFHPWCRGCIAPYFADMEDVGQRYSRNPDTGKREMLPANTTFEEWKARFVKDLTNPENGDTIGVRKAIALSSDGKTKQYAHKIGELDSSDQNAVDQMVAKFENRYVDSDVEHCLIICPNGEVYVARGDERSVETSTLLGEKMKGSFTTHNHPKSVTQYSFSKDDFLATLLDSGKRMRAFDPKFEYEAVFPDRFISQDELVETYTFVENNMVDYYDKYGLDFENYEENIQHAKISEMCDLLGIRYTRRKRK